MHTLTSVMIREVAAVPKRSEKCASSSPVHQDHTSCAALVCAYIHVCMWKYTWKCGCCCYCCCWWLCCGAIWCFLLKTWCCIYETNNDWIRFCMLIISWKIYHLGSKALHVMCKWEYKKFHKLWSCLYSPATLKMLNDSDNGYDSHQQSPQCRPGVHFCLLERSLNQFWCSLWIIIIINMYGQEKWV